jgi:cysteine-rich repeat protein
MLVASVARMNASLRPLRALSLALLLGVSISCERGGRCGDAVLDDGEGCDDGNEIGADGCSASSEPDDNLTLPGDERAGYFVCAPDAPELGITCGPGTVCCLTDGPFCVSADRGCRDVYNVSRCDGPEDCSGGEHCGTHSHGTYCSSQEGSINWCHTDADCVGVAPWLPPGKCGPNGACDFGLQGPEP